mgnify:CR=1 FL=1
MTEDGIAGWLIPSEFMDVNYGKTIKNYLLKKVTLLQIHRFDAADVQFDDALVSSVVVWIKNSLPPEGHKVLFTFGNSLASPETSKWIDSSVLVHEHKWTRFPSLDIRGNSGHFCLSDIFEIKRGIATGDNKFFILSEAEIEKKGTLLSPATARANIVLPVPGGPINKTPRGILAPIFKNFFGFFKKSTISVSSSFASFAPACTPT